MYPQGRHPPTVRGSSGITSLHFLSQVPLQHGQTLKFTVLDTLDRIKEEFQFFQAQYHSSCSVHLRSLKLECEKLASEKTEMQRHYIMVSARTAPEVLTGGLRACLCFYPEGLSFRHHGDPDVTCRLLNGPGDCPLWGSCMTKLDIDH
ncbi:hypothetical protein Z043_107081 [Scleropages formosus]|uniref:Groucho/TLE N-terminal Q-rich domain-containing protein n=1 Tax=Scleropages formosus TaxID=113540 RepID=A0A0P7UV22_SCLFO|nr:hypothetical protein Z043_107081 [Scleropages formosus]